MVEGTVKIIEMGEIRLKVSGHAGAEPGGRAHFVKGWIDNRRDTG